MCFMIVYKTMHFFRFVRNVFDPFSSGDVCGIPKPNNYLRGELNNSRINHHYKLINLLSTTEFVYIRGMSREFPNNV